MSQKPFAGATHAIMSDDGKTVAEYVKVTHWQKDGDHPKVVRYPIERRVYKGLLIVDEKHKLALKFGDYVVEDSKGRAYLLESLPSKYVAIQAEPSVAAQLALLAISLLVAFFSPPSDIPVIFAVTHVMFYSALLGQWNGLANSVFDLDTDTMKVSAHTNTYTPNQDTHDFWNDTTNEVTGTNYTAGGATIGSRTVTRSTNTVTFDGADVVWTQSGSGFSTARKFVIYKSTGTPANDRLYSVVTADNDVGNVTGDLTLAWHTNGIATWSTT